MTCFVGFIDQRIKTVFFVMIEKKDAAKKTDIFCICYFSKNEAKPREKNRGHCLIHLNNQHAKFKAYWQCSILAKNISHPFSTKPFN